MHELTLTLTPLMTLSFLVHSLVAWHLPKEGGPSIAAVSGIVMVLLAARLCSVNLAFLSGNYWDVGLAFAVYAMLITLGIRRTVSVFGGDPVATSDRTKSA